MQSFVAIDVETANNHPTSVCSIGAVKVTDGVITDSFHEFVRPEPNYYFRYFTEEIHGISRRETDTAERFPQVWERLRPFIGTLPLVAHNKAFDERCIRACHRHYGMTYPDYPFSAPSYWRGAPFRAHYARRFLCRICAISWGFRSTTTTTPWPTPRPAPKFSLLSPLQNKSTFCRENRGFL